MKKVIFLAFLSYFLLAPPKIFALSRTIQVEPLEFILSRINVQYEMQTSPGRSVLMSGAFQWDNNESKMTYYNVGAGLRKYVLEPFVGPWFGGKVNYVDIEKETHLLASLQGGYKRVDRGGLTQDFFAGVRFDQPLSNENGKTQINPLFGYTVGFSF